MYCCSKEFFYRGQASERPVRDSELENPQFVRQVQFYSAWRIPIDPWSAPKIAQEITFHVRAMLRRHYI
jgi:hypothetical protein